nr:hypothetical protein [uncultured Lichenicoccus sp.]
MTTRFVGQPRPKSEISRRSLLAVTSATAAAVAVPLAVAALASPDANLIAMCDRLLAADDEGYAIDRPWMETTEKMPAHLEARAEALGDEYKSLRERIGHTPATTREGLEAKARAAMRHFGLDKDENMDPGDDEFVPWSLCRDILGLA